MAIKPPDDDEHDSEEERNRLFALGLIPADRLKNPDEVEARVPLIMSEGDFRAWYLNQWEPA